MVGSHTLLLMWIELGHGERREVYGLHCQVFSRCGMVFAKNDCLSWTRERPQMTSPGGRFASSEGPPGSCSPFLCLTCLLSFASIMFEPHSQRFCCQNRKECIHWDTDRPSRRLILAREELCVPRPLQPSSGTLSPNEPTALCSPRSPPCFPGPQRWSLLSPPPL